MSVVVVVTVVDFASVVVAVVVAAIASMTLRNTRVRLVSRVAHRARSPGCMRASAASSGDMVTAEAVKAEALLDEDADLAPEAEALVEADPAALVEAAETDAEAAAEADENDDDEDEEEDVGEGAGGASNAVGTTAPSSHTMPRHGICDRSVIAQSVVSVSRLAMTRSHLGMRGPSGN